MEGTEVQSAFLNCSNSLPVMYSKETEHQEQSKTLREGITKRGENKDFHSLHFSPAVLTGT